LNFLLHYDFATSELAEHADTERAAVGAMLPDFFRMAGPRVRPPHRDDAREVGVEARALVDGIEHHLAIDRWFHGSDVFRTGERELGHAFLGTKTQKLVLFAHAAWEICLDGAWLAAHGAAELAALAGAGRASRAHLGEVLTVRGFDGLDLETRTRFEVRLRRIFDALEDGLLYDDYRTPSGVARRVAGIRSAFGLGLPSQDELARWTAALEPLFERAPVALIDLRAERARSLQTKI
jgi:hypothetical protein